MNERLTIFAQHAMPKRLLTNIYGFLARITATAIKNYFIRRFIRVYHLNMNEAISPDPMDYPDFNAFFARHLKPGVRTIDPNPNTLISPVDGTISEVGRVQQGQLLQAKGRYYSLLDLVGRDQAEADRFANAKFITLYLAPKDYHRVHMPFTGTLRKMIYIPGKLFSVQPVTVKHISQLFTRNERVVCLFDTKEGPMAVIFVGAVIVGSIHTNWHGQVAPNEDRDIQIWEYPTVEAPAPHYEKGDDIGHFTLGSTVIVLSAQQGVDWGAGIAAGQEFKLGDVIGHL